MTEHKHTTLLIETEALAAYLKTVRTNMSDDQLLMLMATTLASLAAHMKMSRHEALSYYATTLGTVYKLVEERSKLPSTR